MNKTIIAYCVENQFVAAKIASAIASQTEVEKVVFNTEHGMNLLQARAQASNAPVLLLVSDNFLKSEGCMYNALHTLQFLGNQKRLIPVITEGVYTREGNGHFYNVPTSFDRVSNVIQYMNYWQDAYLELRRTKPEGESEETYAERVRSVRAISSEVGEFLRYLRAMEYFTYDQFEDSNFIILHRVLGLKIPENLKETSKVADISHTAQPIERIEAKSNGVADVPKSPISVEEDTKEKEIPPVDISSIPGMNLLNNFVTDTPKPSNIKVDIPPVVEEKVETLSTEIKKTITPAEPVKPTNGNDFSLEDLIADIKKDDRYHVEETEPSAGAPTNYNQIIEDVVNEDSKIADNVVDSHSSSILDEIKNIFNDDKKDNADSTFTHIFEKEEATAEIVPHVPVDIESFANIADVIPTPIVAAPTIDIENTKAPVTASEIIDPQEEETIKNEVSRIFNEVNDTEEVSEGFEYEKEIPSEIIVEEKIAQPASIVQKVEVSSQKSALMDIKEQLSKDPLDNKVRYDYALELVKNNRHQDSIEQLEIIIENDRTNADAYFLMAQSAEQSGDYLLSLSCLEKITLIKPTYPGVFYKLGCLITEHFKSQKRKASHYFSEAIAVEPTNADAHFQLGKIAMEQSADLNVAIEHFKNAVEHNPKHAEAAYELAKAYYEIGDRAQAANLYAMALENNSSFKTKLNDEIFKYEEPVIVNPVNDNGIVALITGATSGIGKATAEIFARNGYRLVLTGRRGDRLNDIKEQFDTEYKNKNQVIEFDVRDLESVKKAVDTIGEEWKNVDILINNAGLASGFSPIHEGDIKDWEVMIDTNIKGLLYMTRAIAPKMVARKKGHIINISSIAGKEIYPSGNVYIATKHAVDALTKAMRVDLYKYNIRVSQVAPGAVEETEFSLVRFHGDAEKAKIYEEFQPLKASDVAESIYFIASRPEYVNIQDILLMGTQQGGANFYDKSGRKDREEKSE